MVHLHSPALSTLQEPNTWMRWAKGRAVVMPGSISHPVSEWMKEIISGRCGLCWCETLTQSVSRAASGQAGSECKSFLQWGSGARGKCSDALRGCCALPWPMAPSTTRFSPLAPDKGHHGQGEGGRHTVARTGVKNQNIYIQSWFLFKADTPPP